MNAASYFAVEQLSLALKDLHLGSSIFHAQAGISKVREGQLPY
jgi:hypothetical protein